MKFALVLPIFVSSAAAFAPQLPKTTSTSLNAEYPEVNGWTADESKFCAGLPGALAPVGEFDPLNFLEDLPVQEIKRYREAEVTHGRVSMLACIGYLVAEKFHPLFNGEVTGPANSHLAQVQQISPFFFAWLVTAIAVSEFGRARTGWEEPVEAIKKNVDVEGKTWLSKLNDDYYPGDIGFDPLGIKPTDGEEFATMATKELQHGRLAMIGAMGMIVQEQVSGAPLF